MADQIPPKALEQRNLGEDGRIFSPSAGRNKDVIKDVFVEHMPHDGEVLEVASGTGEHGVHITQALPKLRWIASEFDPDLHPSINAWIEWSGRKASFKGPITLDASRDVWPDVPSVLDGILSCNMIHIAPWPAGLGLLQGAGRRLRQGGRLFLYGPYARNGEHISQSNADFDVSLKSRNPEWGVRDLESDILPAAETAGLSPVTIVDMPANNFSVVLEKV